MSPFSALLSDCVFENIPQDIAEKNLKNSKAMEIFRLDWSSAAPSFLEKGHFYCDFNATVPYSFPTRNLLQLHSSLKNFQWANSNSTHFFSKKLDYYKEEAKKIFLEILGASLEERKENKENKKNKEEKDVWGCYFHSGVSQGLIEAIGSLIRQDVRCFFYEASAHSSVFSALNYWGKIVPIELCCIPLENTGEISFNIFENMLDEKIKKYSCAYIYSAFQSDSGIIPNIEKLFSIKENYPKLFWVLDAAQALGKVSHWRKILTMFVADIVLFSGHKIGGIKGVGATCFKKNKIEGHSLDFFEKGTPNILGILSFVFSLKQLVFFESLYCLKELSEEVKKFSEFICSELSYKEISCSSNTLLCVHPSLKTQNFLVLAQEQGIYLSGGPACSSGSFKGNEFVKKIPMKLAEEYSKRSLRFSFGLATTSSDFSLLKKKISRLFSS